jgi:hypothetical protein
MMYLIHQMLSQWKEELDFFSCVHTSMEKFYVNRKLKWLAEPDKSAFCIISKQEMKVKSTQEIHEILKNCHICITDKPLPPFVFNEDGLETLGWLDKSVVIHGIS